MKARDHTSSMLRWWWHAGVTQADLAVRRLNGAMIWHHGVSLKELPLSWVRAENARRGEIYVRPARGHSWPLVLLDDLGPAAASRIAGKYDCLVVRTSAEGGCHLWLRCSDPLDEDQRRRAQRWLAQRVDADPASTSGEHLGRLAGLKNWKRGGCWVNVLLASRRNRPWPPKLAAQPDNPAPGSAPSPHSHSTVDTSPSGRDWGFVCALLEAGCDTTTAVHALCLSARHRRGTDADRYARRTVQRALAHLALGPPREIHEKGGLTGAPS
jgi:hypothetical protein